MSPPGARLPRQGVERSVLARRDSFQQHDGRISDGLKDRGVAEVDQAMQSRVGGQPATQLLAVAGAMPFVRGDEGELSAGPEQLDAAFVEVSEEVGDAAIAFVNLLERGLEVLDLFLADIRGIAHDEVETMVDKDFGERNAPVEDPLAAQRLQVFRDAILLNEDFLSIDLAFFAGSGKVFSLQGQDDSGVLFKLAAEQIRNLRRIRPQQRIARLNLEIQIRQRQRLVGFDLQRQP